MNMLRSFSKSALALAAAATLVACSTLKADNPALMSARASFASAQNNPQTNAIYNNAFWLWLVPPLLWYWTSRLWLKAHRGEVDDDPVVFALRDWQSLTVLVLSAGLFIVAK